MLVLSIVQLLSMLALAVVLSGYERRAMALLHHRDAPIAYLLLGLGQPVADGGKLLMKSMSSTSQYLRYVAMVMLAMILVSSMMVGASLGWGYSS